MIVWIISLKTVYMTGGKSDIFQKVRGKSRDSVISNVKIDKEPFKSQVKLRHVHISGKMSDFFFC